MKKFTHIIVLALIFTFACQSNINKPNKPLTYNGLSVSEVSAPFLIVNNGSLARTVSPKGQLEPAPPYGTVYGHNDYPDDVYVSQGNELLPSGAWTDQAYQEIYRTALFGDTKVSFDEPTIVNITNADNTYYLDNSGNWELVLSDVSVETQGIKTDTNGSCSISTNCKVVLDPGGEGDLE